MASSSSPTPATPGADNVRQRIEALIQRVKAEPNNQAPLLQLGHLYAQVWIKNQDAQVMLRVVNCMKRAIDLENGRNTPQFRQLLSGIAKQANALNHAEVVAQFRELNSQLNAKVETLRDKNPPIAPTIQAQPSTPPVETPPASPAPEQAPVPAAEEDDTSSLPDPEISMDIPLPPMPTHDPEPAPEPAEPEKSALDMPFPEEDMQIETVPSETAPEEPEKDRKAVSKDAALTTAREKSQIDPLFENEQIGEIIGTYARLNETRVKRYIIGKLVERLPDWKIEPLLAVAAMESDKQTFRFLMRSLLKSNRSLICQQIDLENYSPDLRQVAIVILGDLGLRSALPKLKQALEIDDPLVRCVALHGIGRSGKAAMRLIPVLVEATHRDPDPNVREAAAKGLDIMNVEEAFDALDDQSRKTNLGSVVQDVLEGMRQRFDPEDTKGAQRLAQEKGEPVESRKSEKARKKASKAGKGQKSGANKTVLVVILILLALAVVGWQFKDQLMDMWQSANPGDINTAVPPPSSTGLPPPTPTP